MMNAATGMILGLPATAADLRQLHVLASEQAAALFRACGIDTPSERLMSFSVPGTTMTPVPITKLPAISAQRARGSGALAAPVRRVAWVKGCANR